MKKLIVLTAALASVTLLSGCKTVVVHRGYVEPVIVDSRHHHDTDVVVIDHDDPRVRHYDRRDIPPQYRDRVEVRKKVIVVNPPARDNHKPGRANEHYYKPQRDDRHDNRRPNPPGHTKERVVVQKKVVVEKPSRFQQRVVEQSRTEKRVEVRREEQHRNTYRDSHERRDDRRQDPRNDDDRDSNKRDSGKDKRNERFR